MILDSDHVGIGTTSPNFLLHIYDSGGGERFRFSQNGNAYADAGWLTFSPQIDKENPTPDDYLDWALEDAKKPNYPHHGMPPEKELDKYAKDPTKIALGTALYVESLRAKVEELEKAHSCINQLHKRLKVLEEKLANGGFAQLPSAEMKGRKNVESDSGYHEPIPEL